MAEKWFGKQTIVGFIGQVLTVVAIIFVLRAEGASKIAASGWGAEQLREYANKLKSQGLLDQAQEAYEQYLTVSPTETNVRPNIYFNLGKAFMDEGRYEEALAYFYKSEIAGADSSLKREIGLEIVTCLEKLGKSLDAISVAEERVSLNESAPYEKARGEVVAKIGTRPITMGEINDELEEMPAFLQQRYKQDKEKAEFIQQYVVNKVLVKKGTSLQYHKDRKIRKQLELARDAMIVQKVVETEVASGIKPDDHDLLTYYEAHTSSYEEEKDGVKMVQPFEAVKRQVAQDYMLEKGEVRMQDYLSRLFKNYDVEIYYHPKPEPVLPEEEVTASENKAVDEDESAITPAAEANANQTNENTTMPSEGEKQHS